MKKSLLFNITSRYFVLTLLFAFVNIFLLNTAFASTKRVTAVNVGTQAGTAISGTATSGVTFTVQLVEAGSSTPSADAISVVWTGATPAGVTYSFSSGSSYSPTGVTTNITLTFTTTSATPVGSFGFNVKNVDGNGGGTQTDNGTLVITAPTMSYAGSPFTFYNGSTISSLTPTGTGSPTSYSIGTALPAGLSFDTTTGIISGTPTATSATTSYTVTANYASGSTATATISIKVIAPTLSYTGSPFTYSVGTAITALNPTVTGSPTGYSGTLPAGLAVDPVTGIISGTPTIASTVASYTITATYAGGNTATATISITVNFPKPVISYTGSPFSYGVGTPIASLTPANTGGAVTTWSIGTALPAGLSFDTSTGIISGTPSAVSATTSYTITATNAGGSGTATISIKVLAPAISYTGSPFTYNAGTTITSLTPTATNGTPTGYSGALPAGLALDPVTGIISGTPTTLSAAANYTITATYAGGNTTTATLNIKVQAPSISYAGSPFTYTVNTAIATANSTEVNGNPTTYSGALPAGLTLNTSTGSITGTPTVISTATAYTITATYAGGVTATTSITITVNPPKPVISYTGSPFSYGVGTPIASLTPANTGGAVTTWSIGTALPAGLSFDTSTGIISGTPTVVSATTSYTITATNAGGSGTATISIKVLAPTISYTGSPFTYNAGTTIASLTPTAINGTPTGYSGALPAGLALDPVTGIISGTPTTPSAAANYTITATYPGGNTATATLNIKVQTPSISYAGSPFTYFQGTAITTASSTEVNGNPTSYSGTLPAGLLLNTSTGNITGTPTTVSAATGYTITATYAGGVTASTTVTITVAAPTISYTGSPFAYTINVAITSLTPTKTGTPSSYSISTPLPTGLAFSTTTGVISGTPTVVSTATTYTITANYAGGVTASTTINVTVNPPKPVISYAGSPFTYTLGTTIASLTPTNTGGAVVTWSIGTALPAGLSFDTSTGIISGTPTAISGTTSYTITATNAGGSGTATISIKVNDQKPIISYSPSTNVYVVGNGIPSLTPTNTGGAAVSYSISPGLPLGMNFNTSTGVISGTPLLISGATTYTITATNTGGSATTTVNLEVDLLAPVIAYVPATNTFTNGTAIATWSPTIITGTPTSYSISPGLPAGLSFNTTNGQITGTPTGTSPATNYTVTASNAGGSGSTTINITCVNPPPPNIAYSPSTNVYVQGTAITTLTPTNTGGPIAGSYSISATLPAGLSFNTATGAISGTPTVLTPATTYTVSASNTGGTGSTTVTITVNPPAPVISYSPSTTVYTTNIAITSMTPSNTGGAATSWSISATLPAGLSFNTTTGVISGTPTVTSVATNYTVTATNITGSGSTTVNLTVNPPPPIISYSPSTNIYNVGTAITPLNPTSTGGPVVTYSISPGLPSGLSIDPVTGIISGTPTTDIAATIFTVTATNAGGSGTTTLNLTVYPLPPVVSYSPSTYAYTVGATISPLTPINTGGTAVTWSIGPSLPAGLSFNTSTGVITGTPTVVSAAKNYIISAENPGGIATTTINISCNNATAPVISYSPSTNVYTAGTAISTLTPINSSTPATSYSIDIPLPSGLSFDTSTGIISGTPTGASSATTYTITGTNSGGSGMTTINLTVNPSGPSISYSPSTNNYTVGTAITPLSPSNSGGAASSYSISTPLPAGLSFDTTTGIISGTPTATSPATNYVITATNATGSSSSTVNISVNNNAPNISYTPATVSYSVGTTIAAATPTNTGGASTTWTITSGTLPSGLTFSATTGVISGTPSVVFPTTTFTIKATNASGNSSTSLIITVSPHAPVISYTPSTNVYALNAPIPTLTPANTGGAVTGYSYSSTGVSLTGGSLSGPSLMFIDASGNIYVANYNNGTVSRWNSSHTYLGTYTTGKGLNNPEGIVFDSSGNCYVEDTGAGAIYKYNSSGVYQSTIISGLNHPLGISIDPSNNLYIATYVYTSPYTSSVTKYSSTGTLLQTISNTQMDQSDGVAVDGSGNIYVLNRAQDQAGANPGYVTKYNSSGTYVSTFSSGYNDPLAIACDPAGDVFVADSHNNQVKIYDPSGVLLNTISGFNDVEGFVADGNGNLYVSDFTNNTVKEFAANGGYRISSPLPAGLSFNTSTGVISGTPTVTFPPTTYTITAYNITGSGTTTVTLSCVQSNDWIGVTSTDWNVPSNWLGNVVPTSAQTALIGVNRSFNFFPTVLTADGSVSVGSIQLGNLGSQAPGVIVQTGASLNVVGALTYQSDASSALGYTGTLSGAGTITANSISVIANTTLSSSYTTTLTSSVTNLSVPTNIALTSSNSGANLFNSTFKVTGGTTLLTGVLKTTNTATSTSSLIVIPTTTATLQLANSTALSGLSSTGTNVVTFRNTGATIQYSGAAQTVYTDASITGLSSGVSYQNITFSGTGIKTASSGNLYVVGNFTNTMANDASNYVDLTNPAVYFNGNAQTLAGGGGNGTTFYTVYMNGTGTKTMISGKFNIASTGVLTMVGSCTCNVLATSGLLTLNSDANSSATFAETDGPVVTGNVNVQRYVTGGAGYRGYRLTSSPVYQATVSSNNVYSLNYLQNSIYLTGNAGGGFDKTGNPTIYLYREDQTPSNATFISGNFWGISAINSAPTYSVTGQFAGGTFNIPVGNGYLFFFRGNRASAPLATETTTTYTTPVAVTMTATGTLNQGQVIVSDWYTPSSPYLGYTGTGTGTNFAVRGFNLVGNPYASTIDWEEFNTTSTTDGIYGNNVGTTIYELNPATQNFDAYQQGGVHTNHGRRSIVSGQGFFVFASNNTNPQLIFNESAKLTVQNTGLNLFMSKRADLTTLSSNADQHLRLQLELDTSNTDDTYIGFNSSASTKFNDDDAPYKFGTGKLSLASYSSDSIRLAINKMPLPGLKQQVIPLYVGAHVDGIYKLNMTELQGIPKIYQVYLMDHYKNDSLDMRNNLTYAFNVALADTNSYGSRRFALVLREDAGLAIRLLNFTAVKATGGVQTAWVTENEDDYTNFTVQRSTDGGVTFNVVGSVASSSQGTYSYLDPKPVNGANIYRLKIEDLNGAISYSNTVTIMYASDANSAVAKNNISIYPNPAKSNITLSINPASNLITGQNANGGANPATAATNSVYSIKIVSASGAVIKTSTTTDTNWQTSVSSLLPGTYIMQVTNTTDNTLVGKGTFVKIE